MQLDDIGRKYGTDKSSVNHNYLNVYETYLQYFKDKPINMLEIGYGGYENPNRGGESIQTWLEYFPKGTVTCLEYYDKHYRCDRYNYFKGDQSNIDNLEELGEKYGPFDLIVDDGSHQSAHIITSFKCLFPNFLKDGGLYIVEDTVTSYLNVCRGSTGNPTADTTTMGFFTKEVHGLFHRSFDNNHEIQHLKKEFCKPYSKFLSFIHFYHELVLIGKGESAII